MATKTAFADDNENQIPVEVESETGEFIPPFEVREKFRPKLIEFFNQTNKKQGAYRWAEEKTLDYFQSQGIPKSAWNYRTRVH